MQPYIDIMIKATCKTYHFSKNTLLYSCISPKNAYLGKQYEN
mgnify:CR=1 FL=1